MNQLAYMDIHEQLIPEGVDWDDFRVFLEVVRAGSFNRAATKLKMTQPTVSRRLMRLESAIGVRLFDRDRRGPRLTQEGQRIFNDANAAQLALTRAATPAAQDSAQIEGECRAFMGDGVASYWMTRFLAPFFARYPKVELKLFGSYDTAVDKRELFDVQVHYYEPMEAEPVAMRVGTMHFIPFASRQYLAAHGEPRSAEDLIQHRLLDLGLYFGDTGTWASWTRGEAERRTALFTNLSSCLGESVRHGAGIALLPSYAPLADPGFVPLDIGIRFHAPIFISYRRDAARKWPVRATIDFLRNAVFDKRNMPWFRETFVAPAADWPERLENLIAQASNPDSPESPLLDAPVEGYRARLPE
ncbi:MAG TPA: LysR family transcriptional regulator [Rhizomicrobium sp.]|nr:LysR family transcriptional regulator [Rhizomicrobium sp.]